MANPFANTCRALEGDSPCRALLAWTLAAIVLSAWLIWFCRVEVTVVEVSESARLEVDRAAHPVAAPVGGKIVANFLKLDLLVEAGDILMELDGTSERLRLREEEARLTTLAPQIEALKRQIGEREKAVGRSQAAASNGIEEARSHLREALSAAEYANQEYQRLSRLTVSKAVSEMDILRARTGADKAKATSDALSSEIRKLMASAEQNTHAEYADIEELRRELAQLEGQIEISNATIARLREDLEKVRIRAPVAGKIGSIAPFELGAFVAVGGIIASIVPDGELKAVAEFEPSRVLGRVRQGQFARMRLDGFPWAQYGTIDVKVTRVATEIRDNRIRVEFIPDSQDQERLFLQHGLPGSIEVAIEQTTPAVLALRAAGQMLAKPVAARTQLASAMP